MLAFYLPTVPKKMTGLENIFCPTSTLEQKMTTTKESTRFIFEERDTLGNADRLITMLNVMEKSSKLIIVVSEHLNPCPLLNIFIGEALSLKRYSLSDVIIIGVGDIFSVHAEIPRPLQQFVKKGNYVEWKEGNIDKF